MDCVHVGDRNGVKGVYDINLIDEVTQFEHVGAVAGIAETFLVPVLREMLVSLPFVVLGFHTDNGSEYVCCFPTYFIRSRGLSPALIHRRTSHRVGVKRDFPDCFLKAKAVSAGCRSAPA